MGSLVFARIISFPIPRLSFGRASHSVGPTQKWTKIRIHLGPVCNAQFGSVVPSCPVISFWRKAGVEIQRFERMANLVMHSSCIWCHRWAQSDAKRFVGCISLTSQILNFWLLPGAELQPGQVKQFPIWLYLALYYIYIYIYVFMYIYIYIYTFFL